jgi:hypothetical protein
VAMAQLGLLDHQRALLYDAGLTKRQVARRGKRAARCVARAHRFQRQATRHLRHPALVRRLRSNGHGVFFCALNANSQSVPVFPSQSVTQVVDGIHVGSEGSRSVELRQPDRQQP